MTKKELHNMLEEDARAHLKEILPSIYRNSYQNGLVESDFDWINQNRSRANRIAEAVIVDFINYVAARDGCDLGLRVTDIRRRNPKVPSDQAHID